MTERIREFLRNRREDGPCLVVDPRMSCATIMRSSPKRFRHARVLRREGEPEPEVLKLLAELGLCSIRPRSWRSNCSKPAPRPTASPSATRSRRSGTSSGPSARGAPPRGRLRGRGGEDRPRRGPHRRRGREGLLPHPVRLRRRRMAAVAEVRLRAGDRGRRARARVSGGSGLRRVVPRGLAAATRNRTWLPPRPPRSSANAPSAASTCRWSISAAGSRRSI